MQEGGRISCPRLIWAILVSLLLVPQRGMAHKMLVDSWLQPDGTVLIEAFFPDGSPAKGTRVEVYRPDGSLYKTLETNSQGQVTLRPIGPQGSWRVVVRGKMGHRAETGFLFTPSRYKGHPLPQERVSLAHPEGIPWVKIIAGLALIFSLASLFMQLGSKRKRG